MTKSRAILINIKVRLIVAIWFALLAAALVFFIKSIHAQSWPYPIVELGSCRDARECFLYCEIPQNHGACWAYGKYTMRANVLGEHTDTVTMEAKARELGITFPISDLGNCESVSQCRDYCEDPANQDSCMAFAQKHRLGAYKRQEEMLDTAKSELGCDSVAACRAYCEQSQNFDKCAALAEKYAPQGVREQKEAMLEKAREELGCDSFAACRDYCSNPANSQQCQNFAERFAPRLRDKMGDYYREAVKDYELPCDSPETCEAYCRSHPAECRQYVDEGGAFHLEVNQSEEFSCNTEAECRKWCEEHPDKCPGYKNSKDYERFLNEKEKVNQIKTQYEEKKYVWPSGYRDYSNETSETDFGGADYEEKRQCFKLGCTWDNDGCNCSEYDQQGGSFEAPQF